MSETGILIGLSAVVVQVRDDRPQALVIRKPGEDDALPFGPFDPVNHETLELGLRGWVAEQTTVTPGYVEQLYTFGNKGRYAGQKEDGPRVISVGYLALTRGESRKDGGISWGGWYDYFPWEDWRGGKPSIISELIAPELGRWVEAGADAETREIRKRRASQTFGLYGFMWDEEKALERYELLYEARLVMEALRDKKIPVSPERVVLPGQSMRFDHRRILATAISRLRGKLKYRPVVFELMPDKFTLFDLQKTVEAIAGHKLHKQNFRRLVENEGLVEETGEMQPGSRGRPAELYRFRRDVMLERPAPGVRLSSKKAG